ncbi:MULTISPECIES: helix-turn-helix domain-containing protein [unclassified Halorhabdus]|uniref:helix-turn-helix domain-containing protein n=1 Tax=unclassified Halorhabdus TaxID=2621901 RepID=UPI0023DAF414|nr:MULTISPECIES: helix-turn-helix domain-containing protein [unclassified Halorhabdus]WEL16259.1 DNA-binding transcriptional regulator, IclR family [Halorhabdus sp. SVX81]WEL20152.1 DNA-binding transcriptional regulator, IclR family [Halorhabdus sp. BNX81]
MSGNTDRDDRGQFETDFDDRDIIRYFAVGRPFHTAGEVADRFDIDRSTAYRRLRTLAEAGRLEKVSLGSRTVVWWYTDDSEDTEGNADPLFDAPAFSVDDPVADDEIDDVLYGSVER